MEENTTTETTTEDTGVDSTQPVSADAGTADNSTADQATTTTEESEPSQDDNSLDWLQSKGIDPNSPEALSKVAEMYRNAERNMHNSTAKASELQKSLSETHNNAVDSLIDPDVATRLQADIQGIKLQNSVNDFFSSNPEAKELEATMSKIVTDKPEIGQLVSAGYLSLNDLHSMARGSDPQVANSLKSQGGKEALQQLADKQQAKAVTGTATTSALGNSGPTKANLDQWYSNLSAAERAKPETQQIVAGLL